VPGNPIRLVLDTNVLLAGLVSRSSASQIFVDALEMRRMIPLLSREVIAEYRTVLVHPTIQTRFDNLTVRRVELDLRRLRYIGEVHSIGRIRFKLPRDPRDEKFLELALVAQAEFVLTFDDDLLSLPASRTDAGRRFRQRLRGVCIQKPEDFLRSDRSRLAP